MAKTDFYDSGDQFASGETPAASKVNALLSLPQTEFDKRWSLTKGFYAVPTVAINAPLDRVDCSGLDAMLDGQRLATAGSWAFTTEPGTATLYYLQLTNACAYVKSTSENAAYLTVGTVLWTLAGTTLATLVVTATVGLNTAGGTGDVTGGAASVNHNLPQYNGTGGKAIEDSGIAAADVSDAVTKKHAQNTDTQTSSSFFGIGGTTTRLRFSGGVLQFSIDSGATWANVGAAGTGDVVGPASAIDNHIVVFDEASGKVIKDSGVAVEGVSTAINQAHEHTNIIVLDQADQTLIDHPADTANPHAVTAAQVGASTPQWNANKINNLTVQTTPKNIGDVLTYDGSKLLMQAPNTEFGDVVEVIGEGVDGGRFYATTYRDTDGLGGIYRGRMARGNAATPTIVQTGDRLGAFVGQGYDGANFLTAGRWEFNVAATPGLNSMPGVARLRLTHPGASDPVDVQVSVDDAGNATFLGSVDAPLLKRNSIELGAVADGVSGADQIGATTIAGLTGNTVQALLEALKALTDGVIAAADALVYKGAIDCSGNPNYPAADVGHTYRVSVAGKIGGAAGPNVQVSDLLACIVDSTASGDHALVGANWTIAQANIDGAVIGPASATDGVLALFDGTTGKLIKAGAAPPTGTNTGDEPSASDTVEGVVELATAAETTTGTDAARVVTPDGLAGSDYGKRIIEIKLVDDATALTTGDGKFIFVIPAELNGWNLVAAHAFVTTVSSSGLPTYAIRNVTDSQDMLSVSITIDANEYSSYTAATQPTINTSYDDVATGDRIAVDKDVAGTGEKGDGIILVFQLP